MWCFYFHRRGERGTEGFLKKTVWELDELHYTDGKMNTGLVPGGDQRVYVHTLTHA